MLMNIMNNWLRLTLARMKQSASLPAFGDRHDLRVFDGKMMDELVAAFRARPPQTFPTGRTIMKEGDAGTSMDIVISGRIKVSIRGTVVETRRCRGHLWRNGVGRSSYSLRDRSRRPR
jgi:hypothetical protein